MWETPDAMVNAPQLIKEFHMKYPNKPQSPVQTRELIINAIQTCDWDQCLFDPITGQHGMNYTTPSPPCSINVLISVPKSVVVNLFLCHTNIFDNPCPHFAPIPPQYKQVWFYEEGLNQAITCIM